MQNNAKKFSDDLKNKRKALGLSQRAFAEATGIPAGTIASIESGLGFGDKLKRKIDNFFAENSNFIVGNNSSEVNLNQNIALSNSELVNISKIVTSDEFQSSISALQKMLNISQDQAALIILENALKNKQKKENL